jgi:hypothetical protein
MSQRHGLKAALTLATVTIAATVCQTNAQKERPSAPEGELPKALIIGDSISGGYTPRVARILKGKALVKHNPGNAQHTRTGMAKLDAWLGKTDWDVIHFNWGLWDLCYRHPESKVQGRRDKVRGTLTTPLDVYEENLDQLVTRLKKTDAALVWAHTTVVPEGEAGRKLGDDTKYNAAATRVMKKHGVTINDLHTLTKGFGPELFTKPGDVHYNGKGYDRIAEQVAAAIEAAIDNTSGQGGDR